MNAARRSMPRFSLTAVLMLCLQGCQDSASIGIDPDPKVDGQAELLVVDGSVIEHKQVSFNDFISSSDRPVVVDFWASWCGPCRMQAPELETLAQDAPVNVLKVDVDEQPELAAHFKVSSIPTMRIFKNGKAVGGLTGFHTADQIAAALPEESE